MPGGVQGTLMTPSACLYLSMGQFWRSVAERAAQTLITTIMTQLNQNKLEGGAVEATAVMAVVREDCGS